VTEINGLHLAYRGLVTGLAAGYAWAAAAMLGALLAGSQPELPFVLLGGGRGREELALGVATWQLVAGGIGMAFAYFFARFFTVRPTLLAAAPAFAVLTWLLAAYLLDGSTPAVHQLALMAATLCYGLMLGIGLPVRGEVLRYPAGSPST
jgi:hypothetical protein